MVHSLRHKLVEIPPFQWVLICLMVLTIITIGVGLYESNMLAVETTPTTHPNEFENVRNSKAKQHKQTGEIWEPDLLHKNHWEVYKNKKNWEKGKRDRSVWDDGRLKDEF